MFLTLALLGISSYFEKQLTVVSLGSVAVVVLLAVAARARLADVFVVLTFFTFSIPNLGGLSILLADLVLPIALIVLSLRARRAAFLETRRFLARVSGAFFLLLVSSTPALVLNFGELVWSAYFIAFFKVAVGVGYLLAAGFVVIAEGWPAARGLFKSAIYVGVIIALWGGFVYIFEARNQYSVGESFAVWYFGRLQGGHLDAGLMSLQFALLALFVIHFVAGNPKSFSGWVIFLALTLGLSMGGARSSLLGMYFALFFLFFSYLLGKRWKRAAVVVIGMTSVALFGFLRWSPGPSPNLRLFDLSNVRVSGGPSQQGGLWQTALELFSQSYGVGIGWGQFLHSKDYLPHLPHNTALLVLVEGGVLMFLLVTAACLGLIFRSGRARTSDHCMMLSAFLLVFICSQFLDLHTTRIVWILIGLLATVSIPPRLLARRGLHSRFGAQ